MPNFLIGASRIPQSQATGPLGLEPERVPVARGRRAADLGDRFYEKGWKLEQLHEGQSVVWSEEKAELIVELDLEVPGEL